MKGVILRGLEAKQLVLLIEPDCKEDGGQETCEDYGGFNISSSDGFNEPEGDSYGGCEDYEECHCLALQVVSVAYIFSLGGGVVRCKSFAGIIFLLTCRDTIMAGFPKKWVYPIWVDPLGFLVPVGVRGS